MALTVFWPIQSNVGLAQCTANTSDITKHCTAAAVSQDEHHNLLGSSPLITSQTSNMVATSICTSVCMFHAQQCTVTSAVWKIMHCTWLSLLEQHLQDILIHKLRSCHKVSLGIPCHIQFSLCHLENSKSRLYVH